MFWLLLKWSIKTQSGLQLRPGTRSLFIMNTRIITQLVNLSTEMKCLILHSDPLGVYLNRGFHDNKDVMLLQKWTGRQGDYICGLHGPNTGVSQSMAGGRSWIYLALVTEASIGTILRGRERWGTFKHATEFHGIKSVFLHSEWPPRTMQHPHLESDGGGPSYGSSLYWNRNLYMHKSQYSQWRLMKQPGNCGKFTLRPSCDWKAH